MIESKGALSVRSFISDECTAYHQTSDLANLLRSWEESWKKFRETSGYKSRQDVLGVPCMSLLYVLVSC